MLDGIHKTNQGSLRKAKPQKPALPFRPAAPRVSSYIIAAPQKQPPPSAFEPVLSRLRELKAGFGRLSMLRALPGFDLRQTRVLAGTLVFVIIIAFGSGAWFEWHTAESEAEAEPVQTNAASVPIFLGTTTAASVPAEQGVTNDMLFNTPLSQLQSYFESKTTPDTLTVRKAQLKQFLVDRKSPFLSEVDAIAEQPHWKLILAISFAESTLGKRCYYNNCSGIGGSNIKTYKTLKDWIVDFNGLLERRYKDKTLEQMCGVYVQPCNPNWLLATRQILQDLEERGIR